MVTKFFTTAWLVIRGEGLPAENSESGYFLLSKADNLPVPLEIFVFMWREVRPGDSRADQSKHRQGIK